MCEIYGLGLIICTPSLIRGPDGPVPRAGHCPQAAQPIPVQRGSNGLQGTAAKAPADCLCAHINRAGLLPRV